MISKIKEYGPITLAWFGGIQFYMLIPNDLKYITCQILILLSSFIIAYIYKKNRYKFWVIHKSLRFIMIFFRDRNMMIMSGYCGRDDLTVDKTKISSRSVYSHFLN